MDTYEEKYNEALERAKTLYENANGMILKKWVEQVFPELADSEEERIRKRLIQYFSTFRLGTFAGIEPKKIIDWLEKQKEFVSADFDDVWETADCNELTAPLEKYSKDAIKEMCHAWYDKGIELERRNWLEKQGEKEQDPCEHCNDKLLNCHNFPCIKKRAFEQGKSALEAAKEEKVDNTEKKEPKKIEQKPWSEEDNFMYNKIKNLLTDISLAPESIKSLFDWLKDLRDRVQPQTTWKPSDEQMDALDSTLQYSQVSHNSFEHLNSLFNDLKKLKL